MKTYVCETELSAEQIRAEQRAAILNKSHKLAIQVAPELIARPLYVCDARDFAGLPTFCGCLGWAHDNPITDWPLADALGDRWQGLGPIIALDFPAIEEAADPGAFERCCLSVLLHEVAHVLPPPPPMADLPKTPRLKKLQLEVMASTTKAHEVQPGSTRDGHGPAFIRRALHLYVRAAALGYSIPLGGLLGSSNPYRQREEFYLPWVLPEALRMMAANFATIEATPPPPALVELVQADVDFYNRNWKRGNE